MCGLLKINTVLKEFHTIKSGGIRFSEYEGTAMGPMQAPELLMNVFFKANTDF